MEFGTASLELPIGHRAAAVFRTRHVNIQLSGLQATGLRLLFDGMVDVRLANGKRVACPPDAVRYVLEKIAEQASR